MIGIVLFVLQLITRYLNWIYLHGETFGSTDPLINIYTHSLDCIYTLFLCGKKGLFRPPHKLMAPQLGKEFVKETDHVVEETWFRVSGHNVWPNLLLL